MPKIKITPRKLSLGEEMFNARLIAYTRDKEAKQAPRKFDRSKAGLTIITPKRGSYGEILTWSADNV